MQACNNRPPPEIKNKGPYISNEVECWSRLFSILKAKGSPQPFPQPTLQPMRALCAVSLFFPDKLTDCFAALYDTFLVDPQFISHPEIFSAALLKVLGDADAEKVLEKRTSPEVKELLTGNTDLALREGAFGLPCFVATNAQGESEGVWGFNSLGQVVDHLRLEKNGQEFRAMLYAGYFVELQGMGR